MQYVAFLRAINIGGRVVKMNDLRRHFMTLGLADVETFIASGNVIFESPSRSPARLEKTIEAHLEKALGYPVITFLRSVPELRTLSEHPLVADDRRADGTSVHVAFLQKEPSREAARKLVSMQTAVDEFQVSGREVLWILRGRFSDSKFSGPLFEKTLGIPATVRNSNTVRRLAGKYCT